MGNREKALDKLRKKCYNTTERRRIQVLIIALAVVVGIPLMYIVVAYLGTWKK